jgi:hypothetical protein
MPLFPTSDFRFRVNSIAPSHFHLSVFWVFAILRLVAPPQNPSRSDHLNGRSAFSMIALRSARAVSMTRTSFRCVSSAQPDQFDSLPSCRQVGVDFGWSGSRSRIQDF